MSEPLFTTDEYALRIASTRATMSDRGFGAIVVSDPANLYYLVGYDAWSFYVPQMLFLPVQGEPLLFLRAMDAIGAHRITILPKENIIGWPETMIHMPGVHPFVWVARYLRDHGIVSELRDAIVAYEGGAHFFTVESYLALHDQLPEWTFRDSGELVNWVRLVKSAAEIDLMRKAAQVTDRAMTAAIQAVRAGRRQCDAAADILSAQASGTPEIAGDYTALVPLMATGAAADTPHLTWGRQTFDAGQPVSIELAGAHAHYHVPMARTISLGPPGLDLARLAETTREALDLVLDAIQPGVLVCDAIMGWKRKLASAGLSKASRLGYSIGIGFPPDWGERTVSLRVEDTTELQENMTFHVIAGMWLDGWGFELSAAVRVARDGVEIFGTVPRELIIMDKL